MSDAMFTLRGMLVDGDWETAGENGTVEVRSPYDDRLIAVVPAGGAGDVDRAVRAARAALARDDFPRADRAALLDRAAAELLGRVDDVARVIAAEAAKPLKTARIEASRAVDTFRFAAATARTFAGEVVPMDASASGAGKTGIVLRVPVGVVAAISPFNFPLNLVAHKIAPAIAAGCPIVLKPAHQTPVSALWLAELLMNLGIPRGWLNVVPGGGSEVGARLTAHNDVAYITFTGSAEVGWGIAERSAKKKVRLELGSNSPLIVDADGDWEKAAAKVAVAGFSHAGQSCISTQRIFLHNDIADLFLGALIPKVEALRLGDPLDADTDVSSLITSGDTERVRSWIDEAANGGAKVLCGGEVVDNVLQPTVVDGVTRDMKLQCQEVFGPVVTITRFRDFDDALAMANDSTYGLQAGVFTRDVGKALKAGRTLEFGGVLINDVPTSRADQQPYGGIKNSGNTREGPAYAVDEMTERRLIVLAP